MKRRLISATLVAALSVSAFALTAAAEAPDNGGPNCVGHLTSGLSPGAQGPTAKALRPVHPYIPPGGMQEYVAGLREACDVV